MVTCQRATIDQLPIKLSKTQLHDEKSPYLQATLSVPCNHAHFSKCMTLFRVTKNNVMITRWYQTV